MDPLLELTKLGIIRAGNKLLDSLFLYFESTNFPLGTNIIKNLLKKENYNSYLIKHVAEVTKTRTIHSENKDVYINNIYHPLTLTIKDNYSAPIKVADNFFIENSKITNIIGFAGQGKSTILKKIFIEQLKNGDKLPFFITLYKSETNGIVNYIKDDILSKCNIDLTSNDTYNLLKSGKIILFLDGFDEVSSDKREVILNEIIEIYTKYNTQIITTTRPDTEICYEVNIENLKVEKLNYYDIRSILIKLSMYDGRNEDELLEDIISRFEANENLQNVMNTPILVTLFYICHSHFEEMPTNAVGFYKNLFSTLYLRHDIVKRFNRKKSSSVTVSDCLKCFCTLCFKSIYDDINSFDELSISKYVEKGMEISNIDKNKHDPEKLKSDLINITCLIQRDGYNRYVFLHKSVQEYHAACFIQDIPQETKEKLYKILKDDLITKRRFVKVIDFLIDIDSENIDRYLIIPICQDFSINLWDEISDEDVNSIINVINESIEINFHINYDGTLKIKNIHYTRHKYSFINDLSRDDNFSDLALNFTNCIYTVNSKIRKNLLNKDAVFIDDIKKSLKTDALTVINKLDNYDDLKQKVKIKLKDTKARLYDSRIDNAKNKLDALESLFK
ncbi:MULTISPECIES: NACHT domain-containing protein [unclassified Providencia]|uniref:NACHT domain-containing protein n=2 Tax=Providencia TaxID=586 RepID=UPI0023492582|nr:NACHT domain-containing protein [Providencia sp. PROV140]